MSLNALEKLDPRKCKAIELRYFAGLSMDEIALALDLSPVTMRRDLRLAEAWLQHQIQSGSVRVTPERWAQIEELFHRAAECESEQRFRLLDEACHDDPDLRRQVDALLSCDLNAGCNMQNSVSESLNAFAFPLAGEVISQLTTAVTLSAIKKLGVVLLKYHPQCGG